MSANGLTFAPADHMVKLQGKDYLLVAARVLWARQEHADWSIVTEPTLIGDAIYMRATIMDGDGRVLATAHKAVRRDGRGAVGQYPVEAAETGAIGRALGLCGYGTLAGDLGEDDAEIADAPVQRPAPAAPPKATNGHAAAAEFHATPLIDALADTASGLDVLRAIWKGATGHQLAGGTTNCLVKMSELAHDAADLGIVAEAFGKAKGRLSAEQKAAVQAAIDEARAVVDIVAGEGAPA